MSSLTFRVVWQDVWNHGFRHPLGLLGGVPTCVLQRLGDCLHEASVICRLASEENDVRPGHPAELISRVAEEGGYDLIVLGHRGHFVRDRLLGSTADRVAEHAPCPVMIVR